MCAMARCNHLQTSEKIIINRVRMKKITNEIELAWQYVAYPSDNNIISATSNEDENVAAHFNHTT